MGSFAISARKISKRFRPRGRLMLRQEFGRLVRGTHPTNAPPLVTAKSNGHGGAPWHHTSSPWALHDVSFEMQHGECMGVIGHNGAGKSVLLRVLARVTRPTSGEADLVGRVSAVLDVGAGFNRELSARDNIYLQGAILGMKKREIAQKFDAIVAFSGMEQFLELPLKQYSNGMQVRLAFAVAAHLDPEIFLMDEVLAVADAEFQRACINKLSELVRQGRTVMLVGHDMEMIRELCPRTLWLERGQVMADGVTDSVISQYQARVAEIRS
ncbi:MAG TPA: ABC transporter ATP-binding protein [Anaerolineae bacterium]|nr:ABC transporter ATP-binding protein [Anaerolineae bacterium]